MQSINQIELINTIHRVHKKSKKSQLREEFLNKYNSEISILSEYFNTNPIQSVLLACILETDYYQSGFDLENIFSHFNCKPLSIILYHKDIENLRQRKILLLRENYCNIFNPNDEEHVINSKIIEALTDGKPMPLLVNVENRTIYDLVDDVIELYRMRGRKRITSGKFISTMNSLYVEGRSFELIQNIEKLKLNTEDRITMMIMLARTIHGHSSTSLQAYLIVVYETTADKLTVSQDLLHGNHQLIKSKLIEVSQGRFYNDMNLSLGRKAKKILKDVGIDIFSTVANSENIISPQNTISKKLIYNESDEAQITMLRSILSENSYKKTIKRLEEQKLPIGIAVLCHGAPGTGKTELVKQIAKNTNRKIFKVDISSSRSMWYGESEKLFKQIFTDYESLYESQENVPILLFNEADALFGSRKNENTSNSQRVENTLQNILLEELENFRGILIATTNMADTLDDAFSRRFLFKIKFTKPSHDARVKIWQSRMPKISKQDARILADRYDLTGGQIENIIRKTEMDYVINGELADLEKLIQYCDEEQPQRNNKKPIGFINN